MCSNLPRTVTKTYDLHTFYNEITNKRRTTLLLIAATAAMAAAITSSTTLWLHAKFNFIPFTITLHALRSFSKIYSLWHSTAACLRNGSTLPSRSSSFARKEYNVRSRFSHWFAFVSEMLKLLFCYVTLTTISCSNECVSWIKFCTTLETASCSSPLSSNQFEIELNERKEGII